jgi:hypothetical protein
MDVPLGLSRASRAERIRLVVRQREQIAALERAQVRLHAAERIVKHLAALFDCVADPAAPATNNAAERSGRQLVTSRKISGGARSAGGAATKMTLASLFGTWRLQGRNPLEACRAFLAAPQL